MMLWDPLNAWPKGRRWLWVALAIAACLMQGPEFLRSLRPPRDLWTDFYQEWASARNYFSGLPIYADQQQTVERHLGYQVDTEDVDRAWVNKMLDSGEDILKVANMSKVIPRNAHPPTTVLLVLPLGPLDYPNAVFAWNLISLAAFFASLWIIRRELAIPISGWSVVPLVTLLLICNPFRQQFNMAQLNLVLLLLLTGCWAAQRNNRPGWAGVLLGIAAAIKLFPAFLFFYFVVRRQWKAVTTGIISLAAFMLLTVSVLGIEAFKSYGNEVIPRVAIYRISWLNGSLSGVWTKLFDPYTDGEQFHPVIKRLEPLWRSPALARVGTWLSYGVVLAVLARIVSRARSRAERDLAFGADMIAMLLFSPIIWDHYLLLLTIPLAVIWVRLPKSNLVRTLFLLILVAVWMKYSSLFDALIPGGCAYGVAYPIHTLCLLSIPCYALLLLFALNAAMSRPKTISAPLRNEEQPPPGYTDTAKRCLNLETV